MVITAGVPLSPKRKAPAHMQTTGGSAGLRVCGGGGGEWVGRGETFKRQRDTLARTQQPGRPVSPEKHVLAGAHGPGGQQVGEEGCYEAVSQ